MEAEIKKVRDAINSLNMGITEVSLPNVSIQSDVESARASEHTKAPAALEAHLGTLDGARNEPRRGLASTGTAGLREPWVFDMVMRSYL